jgi:hypothetical protein
MHMADETDETSENMASDICGQGEGHDGGKDCCAFSCNLPRGHCARGEQHQCKRGHRWACDSGVA